MMSTSTIANSPPSSVHGEKLASIEEEDKRHNPSPSTSEIRRIQRKIDIRIIPWLCFTYLVMKTDYNNITNSAIMNAEKKHDIKSQLKLSPAQWNWVIACFFYPYAFLEPASTLMIKKTTPSFWLGRLMVTWGVICACVGAVQNYGDLIAVRVLQGAAEAGYYPGIIYYLAFWFRPDQMARRVAVFYSFGQLSGFLGGLLAFAISHADGRLAGWRWLFIIDGIPAFLMGIVTFWLLPDYPQTAKFLNDDEKSVILGMFNEHAPSKEAKTWDWKQVIRLFKNPSFWSWNLVWFCHAVGGFGLSFALPTVIFQLGFTSSAMSNVLTMPPYFLTLIVLNTLGYLVQDWKFNPFRVAIALELTNIICCIILLQVEVIIVKYLALCVATSTAGSVFPILWPSRVKAAPGTTAAGVAIGVTNAMGQFSGILGPTIFSTIYGPTYRVSFIVCSALLAGAVISIATSGLLMGELITTKKQGEDVDECIIDEKA